VTKGPSRQASATTARSAVAVTGEAVRLTLASDRPIDDRVLTFFSRSDTFGDHGLGLGVERERGRDARIIVVEPVVGVAGDEGPQQAVRLTLASDRPIDDRVLTFFSRSDTFGEARLLGRRRPPRCRAPPRSPSGRAPGTGGPP
jgi:hypothetical protein